MARVMMKLSEFATCALAVGLMATPLLQACSAGDQKTVNSEGTGTVGMEITAPDGSNIGSVSYTISGGPTAKSGALDVSKSNSIAAVIGGLVAGGGYMLALSAASSTGDTCAGSAGPFTVRANATIPVAIVLTCHAKRQNGSIAINGTVDVCPGIDSIGASPSEAAVGNDITVTAVATPDETAIGFPLAYTWTGATSSAGGAATFHCSAGGSFPITVRVANGDPACDPTDPSANATINVSCTTGSPGGDGGLDSGSSSGGSGSSGGSSGSSSGSSGSSSGGSSGGASDSGTPDGSASGNVRVASGGSHSCARLTDGTVKCWGANNAGQLGDGTTNNRVSPVAVFGLTGAIDVVAGTNHSCALLSGGTVKCWGDNSYGAIGDGTTTNRASATQVSQLSGVTAISANNQDTCALLSDLTVRCWGDNSYGQLGDGSTVTRPVPAVVSGLSGVVALSVGGTHTCAVLGSGGVSCWGYNGYSELGDGTTTARSTPVSVGGLLIPAIGVAVGQDHTCVLQNDHTVRCWGWGGYGQLGDGTTMNRSGPTADPGLNMVTALAAGDVYTCAVLGNGSVDCWGANAHGQLGDGTATGRMTPVASSTVGTVVTVGASNASASGYLSHTCASFADGSVNCWGYNAQGQVGNGTTTNTSLPTPVSL